MDCPFCNTDLNRVVDKRAVKGSGEIRRRRECLKCKERFTTYERLAKVEVLVIKRDNRREIFDRMKLRAGIAKALEKRPAFDQVEIITERIENRLRRAGTREISSRIIGRAVLAELKKLDKIAYLRFTSVYKKFNDPSDFAKIITSLGAIK
ncbi:transcriptional repressor NrdR [Candidatus Daviesbacteria bacterium]|nr:transcriptional repressor NrdR [Candidatus Daviesbacteria bacterium]